jgi:hypothetical protein
MTFSLSRYTVPALLTLAVLGAPACSKKKEEKPTAAASASAEAGDPNADGKRLARSLTDWQKRWQKEEAPPSCDELLKDEVERKACVDTAAALTRVKEAAKKPEAAAQSIKAAAELAVVATTAEQALRQAVMAYLAAEGGPGAAPSGSAKRLPPPPVPAASGSAKRPPPRPASPLGSARALAGSLLDGGADAKRKDNPYSPLLRAYGRLARQALRYLGVYLEQGPEPTRRLALAEVERIAPARDRWRALGQIVRQAYLVEKNPALKEQMGAVEKKINPNAARPRPPGAGAAPHAVAPASSAK